MSSALGPTPPAHGDSTDSNQPPGHHPVKKRKPTYLVRKEEEKALRDELVHLEAQVRALKTQRTPASSVDLLVLGDIVRNQQLGVAAAQSLMMEGSDAVFSSAMPSYDTSRICFKKDWDERRATLVAIWDEKLQNAYNDVVSRSLHMNDGADRESNEKFETDGGDICFKGITVIHFPGVKSLRQVFEALCFYLNNMEISISERLGHITVRDDYDVTLAQQEMEDGIADWGNVMIKTMREVLHSPTS